MLFYKVRGIFSDEIDRVCGVKGCTFPGRGQAAAGDDSPIKAKL